MTNSTTFKIENYFFINHESIKQCYWVINTNVIYCFGGSAEWMINHTRLIANIVIEKNRLGVKHSRLYIHIYTWLVYIIISKADDIRQEMFMLHRHVTFHTWAYNIIRYYHARHIHQLYQNYYSNSIVYTNLKVTRPRIANN